jgi:DNA processing protein
VAQRSGIKVADVMSQLLEYELRGLVIAVPGGYLKLGEK